MDKEEFCSHLPFVIIKCLWCEYSFLFYEYSQSYLPNAGVNPDHLGKLKLTCPKCKKQMSIGITTEKEL